jgi:hypothetical protein
MINQSLADPSTINSFYDAHLARRTRLSSRSPRRDSSHLPAQPQTLRNILPKFRNKILLFYRHARVRQISPSQIRALFLPWRKSRIQLARRNTFESLTWHCCAFWTGYEVRKVQSTRQTTASTTLTCSRTRMLCFGLLQVQVPHKDAG